MTEGRSKLALLSEITGLLIMFIATLFILIGFLFFF